MTISYGILNRLGAKCEVKSRSWTNSTIFHCCSIRALSDAAHEMAHGIGTSPRESLVAFSQWAPIFPGRPTSRCPLLGKGDQKFRPYRKNTLWTGSPTPPITFRRWGSRPISCCPHPGEGHQHLRPNSKNTLRTWPPAPLCKTPLRPKKSLRLSFVSAFRRGRCRFALLLFHPPRYANLVMLPH